MTSNISKCSSPDRLYNGIVLPAVWPPQTVDPTNKAPHVAPYLATPPTVIPIDVGRQLFVDDFLIENHSLCRTFHLPEKYSGNPILFPETAHELNAPNCSAAAPKSGGVWWDPAEKIFKMWYEAGWLHSIAYATSRDGLHWERPLLDVVPGTNLILPLELGANSITVVPDWAATDPEKRYTMRFQPTNKYFPDDVGLCMISADGIHWSHHTVTSPVGDRSTHFYNPFRKKWVQSIRSYYQGRSRHYAESDDFLAGATWCPDQLVPWVAVDDDDKPDPLIGDQPHLYNVDAVAYESLMLGIFEIHRGPNNDVCAQSGIPKITELNFAYSRDGFHWTRPDRRAQIPAERCDVWDRGYVQSVGGICTIRGDKLWFYYSGFRGNTDRPTQNDATPGAGMYDRGATGVAFLRRDGFASMEAAGGPGSLTTRLVTFSGTHLFVNATVPTGQLRVGLLNEAGQVIEPFSVEQCIPFRGDSTLEAISWTGGGDLSVLRGRPVRFLFEVTNGALYSFWVSRDDTGRSDGFVAAGGPGYTGATDTVGRSACKHEARSQ